MVTWYTRLVSRLGSPITLSVKSFKGSCSTIRRKTDSLRLPSGITSLAYCGATKDKFSAGVSKSKFSTLPSRFLNSNKSLPTKVMLMSSVEMGVRFGAAMFDVILDARLAKVSSILPLGLSVRIPVRCSSPLNENGGESAIGTKLPRSDCKAAILSGEGAGSMTSMPSSLSVSTNGSSPSGKASTSSTRVSSVG